MDTLCKTLLWLSLAATTIAQTVAPSNDTQDLYPVATSPRFLLNGTEIADLPPIRLAPLGDYARMSHQAFTRVEVNGQLVNVDASNAADDSNTNQFSYISCDPEAYTDNPDATDVFRVAVTQPRANIIILYTETSDHCSVQGLDNVPSINGILTTTEAMGATMLASLNLTSNSPGTVTILPDLNAYTNSSNQSGWSNGFGQSPTTAVAMIILYSITGIITALFVVIIVTGAIRAHRHPERYGPRTIIGGRGRQSRARGIARAMLDTLPIVKFGDRLEPNVPAKPADVEMDGVHTEKATEPTRDDSVPNSIDGDEPSSSAPAKPDGTTEEGTLGCSICTEDFTKGEEVRVLPCNHKFHPVCVDPWLLNVSGTCPLCRIDLRPQGEDNSEARNAEGESDLPPPLAGERNGSISGTHDPSAAGSSLRRDTILNLRRLAGGSTSEDRIAALRRYRQERTTVGEEEQEVESERRGLARRLRERFRVRTEHGDDERRRTTGSGQV